MSGPWMKGRLLLLVTSSPFHISNRVTKVCVIYTNQIVEKHIFPNLLHIAVWRPVRGS